MNIQAMICRWGLLLSLALIQSNVVAEDAVSLIEGKTADGQTLLTIKHPAYTLEIMPAQGGKVILTNSAAGELTAPDNNGVGLFRECFSETAMEGIPTNIVYTHTVEKNDGKTLVLSLQAVLAKAVAGPDLDGVVLKRTMTMAVAKPYMEIAVELNNPTTEMRYAALGVQHRFYIEKFGNDSTYLPTTRNVLEVSKSGSVFGYYAKGSDWEYEPVEGWIGVNDPASKRGIVFVMDYNALESFYTSSKGGGGVRGWFLDLGELPPKAVVNTRYFVMPVKGFSSIAYASDRLVAGIQVLPQKEKILVNQTLTALQPLEDVTLEGSVLNVRSGGVRTLDAVRFDKINPAQIVSKQMGIAGAMTEPVVVRIKARGKELDAQYEVMYEGQYHAQPIPYLQLAVEYQRAMPERQPIKRVVEGSTASATMAVKERRALLFFGIYSQWYKFDDILKGWNVKVSNARPARAEYLPPASEISRYALVILSDVTADSLPASVIRRIDNYVKKGGCLLVLGGPYAYGPGRYREKGLENLLPIEGAYFDLKWNKDGLVFRKTKEHPITRDLDLSANPMVYWYHQVKVKKTGEVLMTAGDDDAMLVAQPYGAGRVVCFMGSPLGEPPKGQIPFWEWNGWIPLMKNTVEWLYGGAGEGK